jgi:hypothetical protein
MEGLLDGLVNVFTALGFITAILIIYAIATQKKK